MKRPRLLDLFCGAGGCSVGYHRAGFDVVGVDHRTMSNYPFTMAVRDALETLRCLLDGNCIRPARKERYGLADFDAIHASPPCQKFSAMNRAVKADHPDLVAPIRLLLQESGKPWVIENVEGSPVDGVMLCGTMFNLRVRRHPLFEIDPPMLFLTPGCQCRNGVVQGRLIGHRCGGKVAPGRTRPPAATESDRRDAIGVPWMTGREARQAIPPSYTEFIGKQLIQRFQ